jgi:hypothetical protein
MFYIRKRTAIAIVMLVFLGHCPPMAAALPVAHAPVVITDPLDKYRGATELSDTDLVDLLSAIGFALFLLLLLWEFRSKLGLKSKVNAN